MHQRVSWAPPPIWLILQSNRFHSVTCQTLPLQGQAGSLRLCVGFANMRVVKSNIDSGALPPPQSEPLTTAVTVDEILAMDANALQTHLQQRLQGAIPGRHAGERAEDGSPSVSSLESVWVISQIGHAVGQPRLVKLSEVDNKADLSSLRGLTRVVGKALDALRPARMAS